MHILAVLKQNTKEPDIDTLCESDAVMLTEALALRDNYGGSVSVVALGEQEAIRRAFTLGIDRGYSINAKGVRAVDVTVVAGILTAAINKIGRFDLVLFGPHAADGDSAHITAAVAHGLNCPQICYAKGIQLKDSQMHIRRHMGEESLIYAIDGPAVVMTVNDEVAIRHATVADIMHAYSDTCLIETITLKEIGYDSAKMDALAGSFRETGRFKPENTNYQIRWIDGADTIEKTVQLIEVIRNAR